MVKFFANFTCRTVFYALIAFCTLFFPLFFAFYYGEMTAQIITAFIAIVFFALETAGFIALNSYYVRRPVKKITATAERIINGNYSVKCKEDAIDADLKSIPDCVNSFGRVLDGSEQMRKSFISNTSHELRSPLTSIQGFLQAMLDGTITTKEDKNKYLNIVYSETKRLGALINSMLDLSRLESGKNPISKTRFDINTLIRQVIVRFEQELLTKRIHLDAVFDHDYSFVFADKDRIFQVLVNLIDNAIKYSPPDSRICVSSHLSGKKALVSVKDNGYGISQKDQLLIWDRFYMTDRARTPSKSKGSGLGLSIVKRIIDDHGEKIKLESEKGIGSTFTFTLSVFDPEIHKADTGTIIKTIDGEQV